MVRIRFFRNGKAFISDNFRLGSPVSDLFDFIKMQNCFLESGNLTITKEEYGHSTIGETFGSEINTLNLEIVSFDEPDDIGSPVVMMPPKEDNASQPAIGPPIPGLPEKIPLTNQFPILPQDDPMALMENHTLLPTQDRIRRGSNYKIKTIKEFREVTADNRHAQLSAWFCDLIKVRPHQFLHLFEQENEGKWQAYNRFVQARPSGSNPLGLLGPSDEDRSLREVWLNACKKWIQDESLCPYCQEGSTYRMRNTKKCFNPQPYTIPGILLNHIRNYHMPFVSCFFCPICWSMHMRWGDMKQHFTSTHHMEKSEAQEIKLNVQIIPNSFFIAPKPITVNPFHKLFNEQLWKLYPWILSDGKQLRKPLSIKFIRDAYSCPLKPEKRGCDRGDMASPEKQPKLEEFDEDAQHASISQTLSQIESSVSRCMEKLDGGAAVQLLKDDEVRRFVDICDKFHSLRKVVMLNLSTQHHMVQENLKRVTNEIDELRKVCKQ